MQKACGVIDGKTETEQALCEGSLQHGMEGAQPAAHMKGSVRQGWLEGLLYTHSAKAAPCFHFGGQQPRLLDVIVHILP